MLGERPVELEAWIEKRRALDQDRRDEVWAGEYHMVPAPSGRHSRLEILLAVVLEPLAAAAGLYCTGGFNLGVVGDFRVPDLGCHRATVLEVWTPSAAIVVEILSPDDETWEKFGFYAAHEVDEICVVDAVGRTIRWFRRTGAEYAPVDRSDLLDVAVAELVDRIAWP